MGLEEKRHIAAYNNDYTPGFMQRMQEITGAKIDAEVHWDSFPNLQEIQYLDTAGFKRVNEALESLCSDDFGKKAVAEGLKKVTFSCVPNPPGSRCSFENGALKITAVYHEMDGN